MAKQAINVIVFIPKAHPIPISCHVTIEGFSVHPFEIKWPLLQATYGSKRGTGRQIFFDAFDQLRKTDRLGQKWMSVDPQARFSFGPGHESRQKDNRYSMQCGIGLNASRDFAAIRFRHCDIEEDKVRFNVLGCLMGSARIVLFTDEIAASRFQSTLGRIGKVAVVIDYQDTRLFKRFRGLWEKFYFDCSVRDFFRRVVAPPA